MNAVQSLLCAVTMVSASSFALAQSPDDEAQIRAIAINWESAWNAHDMKALVALVTADADFVNVGGKHWKGREQIEAEHTLRLSQFQESEWMSKGVTVQFLKPDIALVHANWGIVGDKDPDGSARKPREGVFTWVVTKQSGRWQIPAITFLHSVLGVERILYAMDYPYEYEVSEVLATDNVPISIDHRAKLFQTNAEAVFAL